jgi:peptide/nickel transport system ATP-binding protein
MVEPILKITELKKWFPLRMGLFASFLSQKQYYVHAVDGISLEVQRGEIFGLVGESGSGKTTTGRMIVRLINPTKGKILFDNQDITFLPDKALKPIRQKMQIIFQDPYDSLNPQMTILNIVAEPLQSLGLSSGSELEERVRKTLEDVELTPPEEFILRFPHELSGGQRQRVATARALIVNPEFVIADEPVSMLDVSIRAEVLNLMLQLMEKRNVSFFYITHDLALARHICNRISVMYLGKMMESADAERLIKEPLHPYTKALIAAVPVPDPSSKRADVVIKGEIPSPVNPPSGCRFHTRCPEYIGDICETQEPLMCETANRHFVACHLYSKR